MKNHYSCSGQITEKSRVGIWIMIVILSIFPGYILYQNWSPEGDLVASERSMLQKWLAASEFDVKILYEASREDFWVYEAAKIFKDSAESLSDRLDKKSLLDNCLKNIARIGFSQSPMAILWTADLESSKVELQTSFELTSSFMFRQLFLQMARHKKNGRSDLTDKKWHQRVRMMFGDMAYSEIFLSDEAEKVFPVLFNKQTGLLVWDFLQYETEKSRQSGFLLFYPFDSQKKAFNSVRIWKNWHRIKKQGFSSYSTWPVFLFPDADGRIVAEMSDEFSRTVDHNALKNFLDKNFSSINKVPSGLMGKPFFIGNHVGRLCHIAPELGGFALLFSDIPQNDPVLRVQVSRIYFKGLLVFWGLFLVRVIIFRRLPGLSVRLQVMAWFLAIAAFPVALTFGAWTAVMQDFYEQKVLTLQRELSQLAINIDTDILALSKKFLHASRHAVKLPGLHQKVFRLPSEPELSRQVFDEILKSYANDDIHPLGTVLITQGGWFFSYFSDESPERLQRSVKLLVGAVLNNFLEQADPSLYRRLSPKDGKAYGAYRVNSLAGVAEFNVYKNFTGFRNRFDNVTDFLSGEFYSQQFYSQINLGDKPFAVFVAIWSPEAFYRKVLQQSLPVNALKLRQTNGIFPDIAVFRGTGKNTRLVESCGRIADMESAARYISDKITGMVSDDFVAVFMPSQQMPGNTIVVRVPLVNVFLQVIYEKLWLAITIFFTVFSIAVGAWWVALWISKPLQDLIPSLRAIRLRKKLQKPYMKRNDEIGIMAETVDKMYSWVRERENLKMFVAPQAVEAVAAGNFFQAGVGTLRKAIILVSDIRSFTAISEQQPAEKVFDMVNYHLAEMARVIKAHGGVIDRFVGDAVWAVFYEDEINMADKAIKSAFAMLKKHNEIQTERFKHGLFLVKIGIGVVRGDVLAGIMGSSGVKLDYSVAGEVLYRAEETEAASKLAKFSDVIVDESLKSEAVKLGFRLSEIEAFPGHFEVIATDDFSYE